MLISAACTSQSGPSETIPSPEQGAQSHEPTTTPIIASTFEAATPTYSSFFPAAPIEIQLPVEGSLLVSPLAVVANINPGSASLITLSLQAEDGRLLARQVLSFPSSTGEEKMWLENFLYFEIPTASLAARLSLTTQDEFGRTNALSSVAITLLAPNNDQSLTSLNSPIYADRIWIQSPSDGQTINSGILEISGLLYQASERPLLIQVLSRDGRVLVFDDVFTQASADTDYSPFSTEINLTASEAQWLQISASLPAAYSGSVSHLSTIEIYYSPSPD